MCKFCDGYALNTMEEAVDIANNHNCDVVVGDPKTLLLDFDTASQLEQYGRVKGMLEDYYGIESETTWLSKKGLPHMHMVVKLKHEIPSETERVALECALGSDPRRTFHCIARLGKLGHKNVSILFKPRKTT